MRYRYFLRLHRVPCLLSINIYYFTIFSVYIYQMLLWYMWLYVACIHRRSSKRRTWMIRDSSRHSSCEEFSRESDSTLVWKPWQPFQWDMEGSRVPSHLRILCSVLRGLWWCTVSWWPLFLECSMFWNTALVFYLYFWYEDFAGIDFFIILSNRMNHQIFTVKERSRNRHVSHPYGMWGDSQ